MYRAHLRFSGCFSRIFGRPPRTAEAALAMHLHCSGVLCTLIGHMESPHPPGTRLQYPQLRQSQLRLVITTVEITSKLRQNFVVNREIPFYRLREVRGRPAAQEDCGGGWGEGGRQIKAGQIDIPNSPWTPQGGTPRRNASFFPCFPYVLRVRAFIFRYLS